MGLVCELPDAIDGILSEPSCDARPQLLAFFPEPLCLANIPGVAVVSKERIYCAHVWVHIWKSNHVIKDSDIHGPILRLIKSLLRMAACTFGSNILATTRR